MRDDTIILRHVGADDVAQMRVRVPRRMSPASLLRRAERLHGRAGRLMAGVRRLALQRAELGARLATWIPDGTARQRARIRRWEIEVDLEMLARRVWFLTSLSTRMAELAIDRGRDRR